MTEITIMIIVGIIYCAVALLPLKYFKKFGKTQNAISVSILLLNALELFYVAGFFLLNPGAIPTSIQEINLMKQVVVPLLTTLPLVYLFIIGILFSMLHRKPPNRSTN